MIDAKLLDALVAVVETGGFERAAGKLNLTQPAVSQRLKQLEEAVGAPLVVRGPPARPTAAGRRLVRHARQVRLMEAALAAELSPGAAPGPATLPVAVNADSLATWFLPAVAQLAASGRMLLDLTVDLEDRTIDHLRADSVLACVSTREAPLQGCRASRLGVMDYVCVATPEFCRRHFPRGAFAESLAAAPAVVYGRADELHHRFLARHFGLGGALLPCHVLPSSQAFVDAALAGFAYTLVPRLQVAGHLASGRLTDVTPGLYWDMPLFWHTFSLRSALTVELTRAVTAAARAALKD
jgi:LysR family transcriptional regulator (chromosome initiation inhibitor)